MIRRLWLLGAAALWGCVVTGPSYVPRGPSYLVEPDWRFHEARLGYPIWREKVAIYELCTEPWPPKSPQTLRYCLEALGPPSR